jgi:hypothetical protein
MAFVPAQKYDVFVSYAHVDDSPLPGCTPWVTTLVECIKNRLGQKLGRDDAYSLWMDHELSGHTPIGHQLIDILRQTATLILVHRPDNSLY